MMLTVGGQRSYSDVCRGGSIAYAPDRPYIFHAVPGMILCPSGMTIYQVIEAVTPRGWMLPVVPGTGWATVGGCIANDVHGKNQSTMGSFGNHVRQMKVGDNVLAPGDNRFAATVGGLGLTGTIEWAQLCLVRAKPFLPWLFPLDYIPRYWPIYKRLGFWQYQCVMPEAGVKPLFRELRKPPLLIVKKRFGDIPSIGMLSFCRPGVSISFDFYGEQEMQIAQLDTVVREYGGACYPAKNSMTQTMFRHSFPRWKEFSQYVDPQYSSDFWQRVNSGP